MKNKSRSSLVKDIVRVASLTLFFVVTATLLGNEHIRIYLLDVHAIKASLIAGGSAWGMFLSMLIFTAAVAGLITLGVPRLLASAVAGIIYGAFLGSILSLAATLIGSSILFFAGKLTLADVVERRLSVRVGTWRERFQENAFWWVLYGRLFPFSNSTVMSLLCGSCSISYSPYILGSLIGFTPLAVVFACYGSGGVNGDYQQITIATVLLILSIASRRFLEAFFPAKRTEAD